MRYIPKGIIVNSHLFFSFKHKQDHVNGKHIEDS